MRKSKRFKQSQIMPKQDQIKKIEHILGNLQLIAVGLQCLPGKVSEDMQCELAALENALEVLKCDSKENVPNQTQYPIQPIHEGRFEANPIIEWLCGDVSNMNDIAVWCAENNTEAKYMEQLAQLVGYSVRGYGTLSYVTDDNYNRVVEMLTNKE